MLDDYFVVECFTEDQVKSLLMIYKNESWTKDRKISDIFVMLENCHYISLIEKGSNEIIAFARYQSDEVYRAIIYDVIVSEKFRGQGFGRVILEKLLNKQLKNVERIELCCLEHNVPFYEKFGFSQVFEPTCFMRKGIAKDMIQDQR